MRTIASSMIPLMWRTFYHLRIVDRLFPIEYCYILMRAQRHFVGIQKARYPLLAPNKIIFPEFRLRHHKLCGKHARIKFDLMHGGFSPEVSGEKSIVLKAEDEVLRHWAQNALNRHQYFCLDVCASVRKLPLLDVQAPDMLLYTDENGQTTCYSTFETLLHNI